MMKRSLCPGSWAPAVVGLVLLGGVAYVQTPAAKPAARPAIPEPVKYDPKPTALGDGSAEMLAVAYSPDRETLVTGGADKLVKLWDAGSGKLLASLAGHDDAIAGLAFSPDGKTLASASYDNTLKLWNVAARKELRTL